MAGRVLMQTNRLSPGQGIEPVRGAITFTNNPHKPGRPSHCYHTYMLWDLRWGRIPRASDRSTLLGLPGSHGERYLVKTTTNDALEQSAAARTSSDAVPLAGEPDVRGDFR
jgi:hypothetical protein